MVRFLRALTVPLVLVALIALSGVVLGRIYSDALLLQLVAGAALGSVGLGAAMRRLPSWSIAPVSVLALLGYTLLGLRLAAGRAEVTEPLRTVVVDALTNGIPRLLTAMIPVEPTPDTVVVPMIAAWLAGLAGHELATRAGGRVLLGLVPPAALYGGALYVIGPNADTSGWPTLTFAGLSIVALAVTARPAAAGPSLAEVNARTRAAVRGRAVTSAALGLVILVGLVAAVGPWISTQVSATPVDPRKYVEPPQVDSLDESPLNRISGWMLDPAQELLTVGASGSGKGSSRLRLAVLSDYDGITWRVGATYRNAGRVLPTPGAVSGTPVSDISQDITISGLTGRLLPAVPTPTSITGTRIAYDVTTGTVIRPEGLTAGLHYTVHSEVQEPDYNLLPSADTPSGDAVARYLTVGTGVPEEISRLAEQLADGNGASYDRASAIEAFLAEHYKKVDDAPSGHAYLNLNYFLFGSREQGGQVGTSEQFAASFALLARLTGLPTRIVVGFDAPRAGGTVTGGNAIAWPEVLFDELGWVPFDPMPKSDDITPVEEDFTPKPSTPPTSDPPVASEEPPSAPPSASAAPAIPEPSRGMSTVAVASAGSGTLLLLLTGTALTLLLLRRSLTRRRLTTGPTDARITGAWHEFTDALRLAGRPVPDHLSATEAALYAADLGVYGDKSGGVGGGRRPRPRRAAPASPAGAAPSPVGTAASPVGTAATPVGTPATPVGTAASPVGAAASSVGTAASPVGTAASPVGTAASPVGTAAGPRPASAPSPSDPPLPPVDDLVTALNTVGFAPGAADPTQATRAATQATAFATALKSRHSWWRRTWWSLHPGPLRWHKK